MTSEGQESYRPREIATRYQVGVTKVLGWIRSGQLKAIDVSATGDGTKPRWRIMQPEVEAFEQRRSSGGADQSKRRTKRRSIAEGIEDVFA